jgi:hypothetical protein
MTELAARHQRRLGGPRWRGAVDDATWPVRRAAWVFEEKVIWAGADTARGTLDAVKWPFERIAWAIERRLIWPTQDAVRARGGLGRPAVALLLVAAVTAVVAGGTMLARDLGSNDPGPSPARTVAIAPATELARPAAQPSPDQTLQGSPPNFESSPAQADTSTADSASASAGSTSSVNSASQVKAPPSTIPAAPGGEKHALRAARDFAAAFVLYEIGEQRAKVRRVFARTATTALVKALRERPPRLPGAVDVPKARVVNVILGERQRKQVDASVSLVRLGNVSELRLTLTKDSEQGWAVSEVRG